jgi:hypothetical protein
VRNLCPEFLVSDSPNQYEGAIDSASWSGAPSCCEVPSGKHPFENEFRLVVNALPALPWAALADGHVDLPDKRKCECTSFWVADGGGRGRMKNL